MTELSFEQLVYIFENDDIFPVDETTFHFDFERTEQHYLGCLREQNSEKPYWAGYCDDTQGCEFATARELLCAGIFGGRSVKDSWAHIVIDTIGGIAADDWLDYYKEKL